MCVCVCVYIYIYIYFVKLTVSERLSFSEIWVFDFRKEKFELRTELQIEH
jgi:hypothetical protein